MDLPRSNDFFGLCGGFHEGDRGCGPPAADRRNRRRGWRLVAANNRSPPLFQLRPHLFVDRLMYLHLLIVVVGLFRLTEPNKVAGAVMQDPWRNR